jgi:hypothetical protein
MEETGSRDDLKAPGPARFRLGTVFKVFKTDVFLYHGR